MDLNKIYEMLGVEKLDEAKQTEIKDVLVSIIETKADEKATAKIEESLSEEKEKLVEEFEEKFEDYKTEIIEKFSNFVDDVIEEEMNIPENVMEYARLGELYEEVIEQFKIKLAIDEGMIQTEVRNLLKEAKDEIANLRNTIDEETSKNLELESDAKKMATNLYLYNKCEGLTESQKKTIINLLGEETSKEKIDSKFDTILESLKLDLDSTNEDDTNLDGKGLNENTDTEIINEDVDTDNETPWAKQMNE